MSRKLMNIETVVVGGGPIASFVVLRPSNTSPQEPHVRLPIQIGFFEAASIGDATAHNSHSRPLTHDLLLSAIRALGAHIEDVSIVEVKESTFYAQINLVTQLGESLALDARPSDAIALAIRTRVPIYAEERVLELAAMPDFNTVEEEEKQQSLELFHDFVENLSPEDFINGDS